MSIAAIAPPVPLSTAADFTPEELVWLNGPGREGRYEWVNERAVKKPMSVDANHVAGNIVGELYVYLRQRPIALHLVEQEYQCFPHRPRLMRKPDVSVVLNGRMPTPHPTGFLRFTPDLAIEVVSPNDLVYDLDEKLEDYRSAGFPLVWVVNPDSRLVRVHTPGQPVAELRAGDTLRADPLLPGFAVTVDALMPPPAAVAAP